jgi:hypothetical protein
MTRPSRTPRRAPHAKNTLAAFLFVFLCCTAAARQVNAASLEDYHARVQTAAKAVEELHQAFRGETEVQSKAFLALEMRTLQDVRVALPAREKIERSDGALDVDNSWLHGELDVYARLGADNRDERHEALDHLAQRLRSLAAHLAEAANGAAQATRDKEAEKGRLNAILRRPEYNEQAAQETALSRLWQSFLNWLRSLMPKSQPLNPGAAGAFSFVARIFVFALTAAVIIFVIWKYGAQLLPRNRARKKPKTKSRVVLGERLAPGETPADLIAQAEALARGGDVRGAIRKAYISVLFELGERNILRLAAHKTNRDYLSAIRAQRAALYDDMQPLTHNYERHWYGLAPATDADWHDFRSRCRQALLN